MKKSIVLICILFLVGNEISFAQTNDWEPVKSGWKYNYRLDTANVITNTIYIDSIEATLTDSIKYLNRVIRPCDTCTQNGNPCPTCFIFYNQPQFMGYLIKELNFGANGEYEIDSDTLHYYLSTQLQVGGQWMFDSANAIAATVINVIADSVLGNADSTKQILLSSNDTIIISKNYGIQKFPYGYGNNSYYHLTGIEGVGMGEKVPGYAEIFDFNVGDVFYYKTFYNESSSGTAPPFGWFWTNQSTITAKYVYADSVAYDINGAGTAWGPYWSSVYSTSSGMGHLVYDNNPNLFYNKTINELFKDDTLEFEGFFTGCCGGNGESDYMQLSIDSNGILTKSNEANWLGYGPVWPIALPNILQNNASVIKVAYKNGLGMTNYWFNGFEQTGSQELTGYVKNGIFVGSITSLENFPANNAQLFVYPNPFNSQLNITLPSQNIKQLSYTIYNTLGQTIYHTEENNLINRTKTIDLSYLSKGIYLLEVMMDGERVVKRVVKE